MSGELSLAAFELEEAIGHQRWVNVARVLTVPLADGDINNLIRLLEQTAAVMRIHEDDFDEYCAARMEHDPDFARRVLTALPDLDNNQENP